jgi:hypothetical protein
MKSPDTSDHSTPPRRTRLWRALRRTVICIAWTATIIALLYAFENWRCRRAWEQYRRDAEARGEHLDTAYFIPPPIPDDQNFVMAGSLPKTIFNPNPNQYYDWHDNFSRAREGIVEPPSLSHHFVDLAAWEKALDVVNAARSHWGTEPQWFTSFGPGIHPALHPDPAENAAAAPGVLRGLQDSGPILDQLQAATSRPDGRYPVAWDTENPSQIYVPFYGQSQGAAVRLRLRATAELELGQSDAAINDLEIMFRLSNALGNDPILISGLVRVGMLKLEGQLIWEGLALHAWSDPQLQTIQQLLAPRDFVSELDRDLAAERASVLKILEYYGSKGNLDAMVHLAMMMSDEDKGDNRSTLSRVLTRLAPRGWSYLEEINYSSSFDALYPSALDAGSRRIFPHQADAVARKLESLYSADIGALLQHRLAGVLLFGKGIFRQYASGQCEADQAAIACALERYRLAHGSYPAQLDALVPACIPALPHDVLTGEPYLYRRDAPDVFVLYSIGWNLKDDGGTPSSKPFGEDGDWVW